MSDRELDVIVLGAGPTGLTTALLLARAGCRVRVLDRDPDAPPAGERAWTDWSRPGVNQFRQAHIALPRWHQVMSRELPEVAPALLGLGGTAVNMLHLHPPSLTGGWRSGDERYATVTARRPVLESALASVAAAEPGITLLRGRRVTGLMVSGVGAGAGRRGRRVTGVRTDHDVLAADLVVDAGGHRTPVPRWLAAYGLAPVEEREGDGLVYYTRHYRSVAGPPVGTRGALSHHSSYSILTLPADNSTWGLAIIVAAADRDTRELRDAPCWEAAVRSSGLDPRWLSGTPLGDVAPLAGLQDVVREDAPEGVPKVGGLVFVGDAWATTSPFLGRGLSLGALQAVALRDAVVEGRRAGVGGVDGVDGVDGVGERYVALRTERVLPYVRATVAFGRHRMAQMTAEAAGRSYATDDPAWAGSTALQRGARSDPVLLRAHTMIGSLLATPADVFADPELRARVGPWFVSDHPVSDHPVSDHPVSDHSFSDHPERDALLDAITRTSSSSPTTALEGALS